MSGYDASGAAHPSQVRESKLSYTAQERDRALAEGLSYTLDAPAGKDVNLIRFIALDDVSGSTGTITIGIQSAGTPGN